MTKKILFILLTLAALASVLFIIFISRRPILTLSVEPKDATVLIDGEEAGTGPVKLRVTKGEHQIQVIKEGYHPYLQELMVNENTAQSVILIPIQEQTSPEQFVPLSIPPYSADLFQPISPDSLIAINKNNSYLIKITKSGTTTLYAKPVYAYSFVNPYVALIERGNLNKIAVINIENGQIISSDAKEVSPVISISLNPDGKSMFLLGKYNPATRASILYLSPLDKFLPEEKGSFVADAVQSLPDDKIVLSLSADAADLSRFSVFDLVNSKYLYQAKGNGILLSPYYESLAVYSSNNIAIVSLKSFKSKNYPFSFENQKIFWKTQSSLGILTNSFPGVKVSLIDIQSGSQTSSIKIPQLDQISVRFILGYLENTLYLLDADGKIWPIALP